MKRTGQEKRSGRTGKPSGSVRIIGGEWRGRRLRIPPDTAVRPTPDRIRETVFNWLGPGIAGARCLDLFAGTGAFGFEALSRGAREAVMIERDPVLYEALEETAAMLRAEHAVLAETDATALRSSALAGPPFDFVIVDPPFSVPVEPLLAALRPHVAADGRVYVERPIDEGLPEVEGYVWHRRARAGRVAYGLAMPG